MKYITSKQMDDNIQKQEDIRLQESKNLEFRIEIKEHVKNCKEKLTNDVLEIVEKALNKYPVFGMDKDDVRQELLLEAIKPFDNYKLLATALKTTAFNLRRKINRQQKTPQGQKKNLKLSHYQWNALLNNSKSPEEIAIEIEAREKLLALKDGDLSWDLLRGIGINSIIKKYGYTKQHIYRIHNQNIQILRNDYGVN